MKKIIVGDIAGIQNFLYNIQRNKSATKRLKWRSLFVEILLEKIKKDLENKLWCKDYLISGWKFILTCENFDQEKFDEYKKEIESKLYKQFYGELQIVFGIADLDDSEDNFKESIEKAYEDVWRNKNQAFSSVLIGKDGWNSEEFVFWWDRGSDSVCKFSRGDLMTKKIEDSYVKNIMAESEVDWISQNVANNIIISNYIIKSKGVSDNIKVFWEEWKLNNFECLKKDFYIPKFESEKEVEGFNKWKSAKDQVKLWDIKSFEALAWKGSFNKLACLKWDIDDLGKLFMFGLEWEWKDYKKSYEDLSDKLESFWKEKLYDLVNGKDIYVVYAWGDDFLMLGKWDEIIEFYKELKDKFIKEFSDIHFSGAINLFWPHDTFFTVVKNTDGLLEKAKEGDKNQITIFGQVVSNDDFDKIIEEVIALNNKYDKETVSTGTFRFLLDVAKKMKLFENKGEDDDGNKKEFFEYGTWKSELFYHLGRNYKSKKEDQEKDKFRNYINGMLLWNGSVKYDSLCWNNDLFSGNWTKDDADKLIVMMSYLLYRKRMKK